MTIINIVVFILVIIFIFSYIGFVIKIFTFKDNKRLETFSTRRAIFMLNELEASSGYLSTDRLPDFGDKINIKEMTDEEFFNRVTIISSVVYCNNPKSVDDREDIELDIARKKDELHKILFAEDMGNGDLVQVIITK